MNNKLTPKERRHLARVKMLPCSVCDAPGPSEAHHVKQHKQWICLALCKDCHNSWHGTKALWRVRKMDELDALNVMIERLLEDKQPEW